MRSVDVRTRTDADVEPVDAGDVLRRRASRCAGRRTRRPRHRRRDGAEPEAARRLGRGRDVDAGARRRRDPGRTPGTATPRPRSSLDDEGLTDLVHDVRTPMGFFTGGDLDMPAGRLEDFLDWWVVLRSLLDARPGAHARRGRRSAAATASRSTSAGRSRSTTTREDLAHFLAEAGFLHLTGVFTEDEMAADRRRDGRRRRRTTRPTTAGRGGPAPPTATNRLVRLSTSRTHSPTTVGAARRRSGSRGIAALTERRPPATASRAPTRQPRRGAGQADRRRRGHLRRAVAQGLQPRQPLVPVLLADRRHLGHRRGRAVGPAPGRGRVAPRPDPARVRTAGPRPAPARPADRAPATSPSTSAARCT